MLDQFLKAEKQDLIEVGKRFLRILVFTSCEVDGGNAIKNSEASSSYM